MRFLKAIFDWFRSNVDEKDPAPLPPVVPQKGLKIGLVVGHDMSAKGAWNYNKTEQEYDFFKDVLSQVVSQTENTAMFLRDGTSIRGAIDKAASWSADVIIEFHWNAFNGKAQGSEALSFSASNELAREFLVQWCTETGLANRGVKKRTARQAGYTSVQRIHERVRQGFLWEAFFGDEPKGFQEREIVIDFLVRWIKQKQGA